jgi:hypothetical protein
MLYYLGSLQFYRFLKPSRQWEEKYFNDNLGDTFFGGGGGE